MSSSILRVLPFLGLAVVVYFVGVVALQVPLNRELLVLPLPSGAALSLSFGDVVLLLGLILFFIELLVSTRPTQGALLNHGLSMALFVGCLLLILLVPACGTATFFFLTMLTLIDVISGYSISIITARRDLTLEKSL
ncbi:MAG: hypothetical protein ACRCTI_06050 [Beijerinckiaceae bacterium]